MRYRLSLLSTLSTVIEIW